MIFRIVYKNPEHPSGLCGGAQGKVMKNTYTYVYILNYFLNKNFTEFPLIAPGVFYAALPCGYTTNCTTMLMYEKKQVYATRCVLCVLRGLLFTTKRTKDTTRRVQELHKNYVGVYYANSH